MSQKRPGGHWWLGAFSRLVGALLLAVFEVASPAIAADAPAPATSLHTFTNNGGNSFKAQITAVTGDEVSLKREDGEIIHPKISVFNKEDQIYIQFWAARDAATHGPGAFDLHAISIKSVVTSTDNHTNHQSISTWKEYYRLETKNLTFVNWTNLHFRFIVFKQSERFGEMPPNDFTMMRITGTFDVEKYAGGDTKNFTANAEDMQELKLIDGFSFVSGPANDLADKFIGIWVRAYDDDENLLQEWVSDPAIAKTEIWAYPRTAGARGTIPPRPAK